MEKGLPLPHSWKLGVVSSIACKQISWSQMEQLFHWNPFWQFHNLVSLLRTSFPFFLWFLALKGILLLLHSNLQLSVHIGHSSYPLGFYSRLVTQTESIDQINGRLIRNYNILLSAMAKVQNLYYYRFVCFSSLATFWLSDALDQRSLPANSAASSCT